MLSITAFLCKLVRLAMKVNAEPTHAVPKLPCAHNGNPYAATPHTTSAMSALLLWFVVPTVAILLLLYALYN